MEVDVELSKKTTILFPPELHEHLVLVAKQRGVSLGHLVRTACEAQYRTVRSEDRLMAARKLGALGLPVGEVGTMKAESVLTIEDLSS